MAALPALLLLLLSWSLACHASPLQNPEDDLSATGMPTPTGIPTVPASTEPPIVITVQEQIYIITGVFITLIIFLLAVSLSTAYVVIGMRQTMAALRAAGAGPSSKPAAKAPQRQPSKRPAPAQAQAQAQPLQQYNRAFVPDDDYGDDNYRGGDDIQNRGYDQYPDHPRNEPPRAGRQLSSPSHVSEPQGYDRFHQPLPDAHMPSDRATRKDSNSRYGAGNLARLPKGQAPQPGGYEGRHPEDRERLARSPGRSQW